jgi:hypothetical protein
MRYKGQLMPRRIDRAYPHQVEIATDGGLGTLLNAMHDFCRGATFGHGRKREAAKDWLGWRTVLL